MRILAEMVSGGVKVLVNLDRVESISCTEEGLTALAFSAEYEMLVDNRFEDVYEAVSRLHEFQIVKISEPPAPKNTESSIGILVR
jgi:phosphatidylserine/phosphatidylglycerophosphate/cardiolipin synthase-like enzyme